MSLSVFCLVVSGWLLRNIRLDQDESQRKQHECKQDANINIIIGIQFNI